MSRLVRLTRPQKRRLQRIIHRGPPARPVRRAQVLLQLASGVGITQVSEALSVARSTVYRWVAQFRALGEGWLMAHYSNVPFMLRRCAGSFQNWACVDAEPAQRSV